jgi:hypothetical protein
MSSKHKSKENKKDAQKVKDAGKKNRDKKERGKKEKKEEGSKTKRKEKKEVISLSVAVYQPRPQFRMTPRAVTPAVERTKTTAWIEVCSCSWGGARNLNLEWPNVT